MSLALACSAWWINRSKTSGALVSGGPGVTAGWVVGLFKIRCAVTGYETGYGQNCHAPVWRLSDWFGFVVDLPGNWLR